MATVLPSRRKLYFLFLLWAVSSMAECIEASGAGDPLPADVGEKWVDPDNMFTDSRAEVRKAVVPDSTIEEEPQAYCNKYGDDKDACDAPLFKHTLRSLSNSLNVLQSANIEIRFTQEQIQTLTKYLSSEKGNVHDISDMLKTVFSGAKVPAEVEPRHLQLLLHYLNHELAPVIAIVTASSLLFGMFQMKTRLTWRQQLVYIVLLGILVSIPWEWVSLYRKEFAKKQLQAVSEIPKHCVTGNISAYEAFNLWMKNTFTFSEDPCYKYQEALLVDPLWEVTPLQAISVSLTKSLVKPMQHVAEASGKSFRALFNEIPVQWQPPVFIVTLVLMIWLLIAVCGGKISSLLLTIDFKGTDQSNMLKDDVKKLLQLVENQEKKEEENKKYLQVILKQVAQRNKMDGQKQIKQAQEDEEKHPYPIQQEEIDSLELENLGLAE